MKIANREYPVIEEVTTEEFGTLPMVDIPFMSDLNWHKQSLQSRLEYPEVYRALGEDVEATIAHLCNLLKEGGEA